MHSALRHEGTSLSMLMELLETTAAEHDNLAPLEHFSLYELVAQNLPHLYRYLASG